VNFAPVLDVLTDGYSPNIGIRAYGKDPEWVAKMGAARIAAMQVEGISACAKHSPAGTGFPGSSSELPPFLSPGKT